MYAKNSKLFSGGGKFIGKKGYVGEPYVSKVIDLPSDALPSETEFDRNLNAITISHGKNKSYCCK